MRTAALHVTFLRSIFCFAIIISSSLMLFNDLNRIGVISRDVRQKNFAFII